jgi:hypothetical protein
VSADWDTIYRVIMERATQGLNEVGAFATKQAKRHAPVRNIFSAGKSRNPRGKAFRGPRRNNIEIDYHWNARDYKDYLRSKRRTREVFVRHEGDLFRTRGNVATMIPLLRPGKRGQAGTITGNFRQYNPSTGRLARVKSWEAPPGKQIAKAKGRRSGQQYLSARGRYEVKTQRALSRGSGFGLTVGGRLRREIYQQPAALTAGFGGQIWTYVISPTPYAVHQEYGTSRHRAQPFLRPALYESRAQLRQAFTGRGRPRSAMTQALQTGTVRTPTQADPD